MNKLGAGLAVTAVAALVGGTLGYTMLSAPEDAFTACRENVVAGGAAAIGGPFTLVSEAGNTVTDAEVITVPSLVYFGYTFCPDVCPFDTVRNADAAALLAERGHEAQTVFITVDPERDTPERIAEFTDYIDPGMIGLTGTADQVQAAVRAYKAYFRKQDSGDEFYLVDHSTFTYLVLPDHGFVEFYRRDLPAAALADSAACFLEKASEAN